ncbi:MAG TPA: hypothetical protein EYH20_08750 [Leucothrix sp.]|nr:hypothetical protein [Leucothrix sp.]
MNRKIIILILFLTLPFSQTIATPSLTIDPKKETRPLTLATFFTRPKNDSYYSLVVRFAEHVAKSYNIKLQSYYFDHNHIEMVKKIEQVLSSNNRPDAIAFVNFKQQDETILKIANKYKTPAFIFNSTPSKNTHSSKYFVSTVSPDDEKAGYDLAEYLIQNSKKHKDGKIYLVGIEGDPISSASILRKQGLLRASKRHNNVVLQQIVSAYNWNKDIASSKTDLLLKRYPKSNMFWAASDSISIGIHETLIKHDKSQDIIVGGIDWSEEGINAVKKNKIAATYGNQFMELGWVTILTYDFLVGNKTLIPDIINTPMQIINKDNIQTMNKYLTKECWNSFDFTKLSKTLNPSLTKYQFKIKC